MIPGIERCRDVGVVARIGALRHRELAEHDRAGDLEPVDDRGIEGSHEACVERGAGGGRRVARIAEVLHSDRHAVQRALAEARGHFLIRTPRLLERAVSANVSVASVRRIQALDAIEHRLRHRGRRQLSAPQRFRDFDDRLEVELAHRFPPTRRSRAR